MSYYTNYIGYKQTGKQIGFGEATIATGGTLAPVTLIIDAAIAFLPALIPWISNAFKHPAKDAIKIIDTIKPQMANSNPRDRLGLVLAAAQKISPDARDVSAEKLFLWYKLNYPNDYQTLLPQDKEYYNKYLATGIQTQADGNNFWANSQRAMFTNAEINYNATPVEAASNILSNVTKSTSSLLLYLGIGLGLFLILKKKK
jgi:hypothetical protein